MSNLLDGTLRSRLGKRVKSDRLEQLIDHYKKLPEGETAAKVGAELSDDKLFLGFMSGVPSFREVHGILNHDDLEAIAGVSQKLARYSPKLAFSFLKTGKEIIETVPEYGRKNFLSMANRIPDPLALWTFIENSGSAANDAEKLPVLNKWFDDGLSLNGSDQVAHFGPSTKLIFAERLFSCL